MVIIKVNDSGECRVTVKGPWDTVKKNLETAATKVREMAHDSRKFASITEGTYAPPMKMPRQQPMVPREDQQDVRPARQPLVNRPVPTQEQLGAIGYGLRGATGGGAA